MRPILDALVAILEIYKWILILSAIFSWLYAFNVVNSRNRAVAMIGEFLYKATEPVLRPIRRIIPDFGGLDISPVLALLAIFVLQAYLQDYLRPILP